MLGHRSNMHCNIISHCWLRPADMNTGCRSRRDSTCCYNKPDAESNQFCSMLCGRIKGKCVLSSNMCIIPLRWKCFLFRSVVLLFNKKKLYKFDTLYVILYVVLHMHVLASQHVYCCLSIAECEAAGSM